MGILERFTTIMKSNVNALLDKAEDPSKMVDQTLRTLREDLAEVKKETANVMAEEKRVARQLEECQSEIARMDSAARKALTAGNENDARTLLAQKQALTEKEANLQQAHQVAKDNADKMRAMHDKLVSDIEQLEMKKDSIKAKISVAKAQEHMVKATKGLNSSSSIEAFERMEAKADKMLDASSAMLELNEDTESASANSVAKKYETGSASVEDELAKLKAEMGLS
jgi:phage shock protein A